MTVSILKDLRRYGKSFWRARPYSPATFLYKDSKFSKNSNWCNNLLFNARDLNLGYFGIFDMLFPFLAFFKL